MLMLESINKVLKGTISLKQPPRVLIVTAEDGRRFVGAAQPDMLIAADREAGAKASGLGQENARMLEEVPVVTVAAVDGSAIRGGPELVLGCDFVLSTSSARFARAEVLRRIVPGFGGSYQLTRRVGVTRAKWMTYTRTSISAATASEWGVVLDTIAGQSKLMTSAFKLAGRVLAAQPEAVKAAKKLLIKTAHLGLGEASEIESIIFANTMGSEEIRAGMAGLIALRDGSAGPP